MPRRGGWFTSSYTNGNGCVEVKFDGDTVLIRDTKYRRNPANDAALEPIITLPANKWKDFLEKVVDRTAGDEIDAPVIERDAAGGASLRAHDGTILVYNEIEWTAFLDGVRDGEFALVLA